MSLFSFGKTPAPAKPLPPVAAPQPAAGRFITRQPLLDAQDHIVAYEFKHQERAPLEVLPGAASMRQVQDEFLLVSVIDLDFQQALGNKLTFLGVAPETLLNPLTDQLPPGKVVLALSPQAITDPAIVARAEALAQAGRLLSLDDLGEATLASPLLPFCHYIRVDTSQFDVMALADRIALLQRGPGPGPRHQLIAAQVDTQESFETCAKLGFGLFQGAYFTRLSPTQPSRLDSNVMRVMDLLNKVVEHAEFQELEDSFKLDPALSYKLLRYINSPAIGLRTHVKSLGHALTLLGYDQTYRWLTLLLFSGVQATARNTTLLRNALARAHFTEALGKERFAPDQRGGLFICGIFSLLDALLNVPMTQALANLTLPEHVTSALVHGDGPYAPYLALATACEHFDQDSVTTLAEDLKISSDAVNLAHVEALIWAERVDI